MVVIGDNKSTLSVLSPLADMERTKFRVYLGSVPGNLSETALAKLLRKQVSSFSKVVTTQSNSNDTAVKNNGYAFMTVREYEEYLALINGEKVLTIGDRTLKASVYKCGSALRSEIAEVTNKKLYIRGIPRNMDDKKLQAVLEFAGLKTVLAFRAQKSSTLEKLDFGFAEFDSAELAEKALEMGKLRIPNTRSGYLTFERYQPKPAPKSDEYYAGSTPWSKFGQPRSNIVVRAQHSGNRKPNNRNTPSVQQQEDQNAPYYQSGPVSQVHRLAAGESSSGPSNPIPRLGGSISPPIAKPHPQNFNSSVSIVSSRSESSFVFDRMLAPRDPATNILGGFPSQEAIPLQMSREKHGNLMFRQVQRIPQFRQKGYLSSSAEFTPQGDKFGSARDENNYSSSPGITPQDADILYLARPWL